MAKETVLVLHGLINVYKIMPGKEQKAGTETGNNAFFFL
jgi:hypothetical protein